MENESLFKNSALIGFLVKRIKEEYPSNQVGKTIIQKMIYILTRINIVDFDYSMYHYGPYSSKVSSELNFCESIGFVQVKWIDDKGYFIETTPKLENFENHISEKEKQAIDDIVKKYGFFSAIELSIIATAFFLKDNFGVHNSKLIPAVHNIKNNHSVEYIEKILQKAEVAV